jgi:Protein of unknown function (DUF3039)
MADLGTGTDVDVDTDLDAAPPMPDEHEPVAHWVRQADLAKAMAEGHHVRALCGYVFDPRIPWPKGLPVCKTCAAIKQRSSS